MPKKVRIDPGHAPGNANRGPTGYCEYQGMWALSNHLKKALERCGVVADLTRRENEDPSLSARGGSARGYDVFFSEHSNAGGGGQARGCEVFYSVSKPGDKRYAADIAAGSAKCMGNPNRGAKTRISGYVDYYGVIRAAVAAGCPHVFLAESGFHDNRLDEAWLKKDDNLKKLAEVQAKGICEILNVHYLAPGGTGPRELYRVQVGAYSVKKNADIMSSKLKADGYDTYMVVGDDGLYKVQIGAFGVKSNADRLATELKRKGYETYITTKQGNPVSHSAPEEPIKVGSRVGIKQGAKTYTGGSLASFVYSKTFTVSEIVGHRVVIRDGNVVVAAMNIKDLVKR